MIRAAGVLVCLASLASTAEASGAGAIALPPLEVDIGANMPVHGGEAIGVSTEILIGIHWASLYWKPTSWDLGIGYVGSRRALNRQLAPVAERMVLPGEDDPTMKMDGVYLTLSRTLVTHGAFRTWVDLRGELLRADTGARTFSSLGGAVRFAAEIYWSGVGGVSDRNAIALFAGTWAVGVFVEGSHRELASQLGPTGVTSGISIRIPFLFAAASS